jgi:toxin ParE1/3/4
VTRFFLTPLAEADLEAIWDYTEEQWGLQQAERYVAAIKGACVALAARAYPDRNAGHVRPGFRTAAVGSHVLYFLRRGDGAPEIIRILHQRMDGPRHLT